MGNRPGTTNLRLRHKVLLLLAVPLVLQLAFLAAMALLLKQADQEITRDARRREVVVRGAAVNDAIYAATVALDIYSSSHNALAKSQYDRAIHDISSRLSYLQELAEPEYPLVAEGIGSSTRLAIEALRQTKLAIDDQTTDATQYRIRQLFKQIKSAAARNQQNLGALDNPTSLVADLHLGSLMKSPEETRRTIAALLIVGVAITVLLSAALAYFFTNNVTRRLEVITRNTHRLAAGLPLQTPMPGRDEIANLDHTFHDMQKAIAEAARKERAILENSADVICSLGAEGQITAVTESSSRLWGFAPQELLGKHFIGLIDVDGRDYTLEQISKATASDANLIFENRLVRKDGRAADMAWSVRWVEAEKSLYCVVRDISEQKKLERLKEDFVAMISHDLRTPLSSLLLFLEMLTEGLVENLPPSVVKRAQKATDEVSRLAGMVNNLLEIAKMEAGQSNLNVTKVALANVIQRSVAAVSDLAAAQQVNIADVRSQAVIMGDEERLVRVLVNLLSNAIQYSPKGSSIRVRVLSENGYVSVKVSDQGPGIARDDQSRIFDRFEQANLSGARIKGSAGLGLAICKAIVDEHKGSIGVESEPGQGSTFWFKLPAMPTDGQDADGGQDVVRG